MLMLKHYVKKCHWSDPKWFNQNCLLCLQIHNLLLFSKLKFFSLTFFIFVFVINLKVQYLYCMVYVPRFNADYIEYSKDKENTERGDSFARCYVINHNKKKIGWKDKNSLSNATVYIWSVHTSEFIIKNIVGLTRLTFHIIIIELLDHNQNCCIRKNCL